MDGHPGDSFGGTIVLADHQPLMPLPEDAGVHQGSQHSEPFRLDLPGLGSQPAALVMVEAGLRAQWFLEDADLLLEVFEDLLVAVDPPRPSQKQ